MSSVKSSERACPATSRSVAKRLAAYSAAATSAAFVGTAADGSVVVVNITPQNVNSTFTIDLSAAGTNGGAYTFRNWVTGPLVFYCEVNANPQPDSLQFNRAPVLYGDVIPTAPLGWVGTVGGGRQPGAPATGGGTTATTIYVPFKLTLSSGDNRYGWVEYVQNSASPINRTVSRWAYETQLNTGLVAGVVPSAVPGAGGLLGLTVGAAGLRGRRRGRN
ncbi:MAG: hypothetical protein ACO3SJ_01465 [Phycisphaerales bacterium]